MATRRSEPSRTTVHLLPKAEGWVLVLGDAEQPGAEAREFPDLGLALDAAVAGNKEVHIVVHEAGAA